MLTKWEAVKVVGKGLQELGEKGEAFEEENPGANYVPSKGDIADMVLHVAQNLGVEFAD